MITNIIISELYAVRVVEVGGSVAEDENPILP